MTAKDDAARARAAYAHLLREERDGYMKAGKAERAAAVDAELARVEGRPVGRSESAVEPKPRRRAKGE